MARYYVNFNSFAEVENKYNNTTPIAVRDCPIYPAIEHQKFTVEQWLLGWDVRPTNCRARKHERVIKLSANRYALASQSITTYTYTYRNVDARVTKAEFLTIVAKMSPIIWYKDRQGNEFLEVRNATDLSEDGSWAHNGHYSFLDHHLPYSLRFHVSNGKQSVGGYFLPKRTYLPTPILRIMENRLSERNMWHKKQIDRTSRKGDYKLVFRHDTTERGFNHYELVGNKYTPPKFRIDTKAKSKYRRAIAEFREATLPIAMIQRGVFDGRIEEGEELAEVLTEVLYDKIADEDRWGHNPREKFTKEVLLSLALSDFHPALSRRVGDIGQLRRELVKAMHVDSAHHYVMQQVFFKSVENVDRQNNHYYTEAPELRDLGEIFNSFINRMFGFKIRTKLKVEA